MEVPCRRGHWSSDLKEEPYKDLERHLCRQNNRCKDGQEGRGTRYGRGIDGGIVQQEHRIRRRVGCSKAGRSQYQIGPHELSKTLEFYSRCNGNSLFKVGK